MHPQENQIPTAAEHAACRMHHSTTTSKLWQSTKNTNPQNARPCETSQSGRSQINNLIKTTSSTFFFWLLTFCILVQQASLAGRIDPHNENKLPNGTAPLLTIKKRTNKNENLSVTLQRAKFPLSLMNLQCTSSGSTAASASANLSFPFLWPRSIILMLTQNQADLILKQCWRSVTRDTVSGTW